MVTGNDHQRTGCGMVADQFLEHFVRLAATRGEVNLHAVFFPGTWQARRGLAGIKDNRGPLPLGLAEDFAQPVQQRLAGRLQGCAANRAKHTTGVQQVVPVNQSPSCSGQCRGVPFQVNG